jgi:hypothetical protein
MICLSGPQEASFVGEGEKRVLKFTKYLESFPFPYYIVLKNIEALPRTLADLLRQVSLFYNFCFLENNYFIEAPTFLIMLIFIFSFMVAVV